MTRNDHTGPAARLEARRARTERAVRVVGHWTPELLGAALAAAGAVWIWPGMWAAVVLLLARIPAHPLLTRWRAHRAKNATRRPLLTDNHPTDTNHRSAADTDWEATA